MIRGIGTFLFVTLCAPCAMGQNPASAPTDQRRKELRFVLEGFLHNRDAFETFSCMFKYSMGTADTLDEAFKGNPSDPNPQHGVWYVRGQKYFYQLHGDEQHARQAWEEARQKSFNKRQTSFSVPPWVRSDTYLSDGAYKLFYGAMSGSGELTPPTGAADGPDVTPWSLGVPSVGTWMHPVTLLNECLQGKHWGALRDPATLRTGDLVTVEIADKPLPEERGWCDSFTFDPKRGFLPISMSYAMNKQKFLDVHVLEARQVVGDRWFPMHCISILYPKNGSPYRVTDIRVTELDVDKAPGEDKFAFIVPVRSQFHDNSLLPGGAITTVEKGTRVGLKDLKRFYTECLQNYKEINLGRRAGAVAQRKRRVSLVLLVLSGLASVLVVGCFIAARHRRSRRGWSTGGDEP